jgi:hypothetical protein
MPVERYKWPYMQVADGIAARIASGEAGYREGDQLPTLERITAEWDTSHETAHRAMMLLRSRKLITTIPRVGSFVGPPREIPGPQQLLAGIRFPAADRIEVITAKIVPAPEYIAPILGLLEVKAGFWPAVLRRQVLHGPGGRPLMFTSQWFPAELPARNAGRLLALEPLPPGDELALLGEAGRPVTRWTISWETRKILDDGREGRLLQLKPGDYVQAVTYTWGDEDGATCYSEYCLLPNLVTVAEGTVAADAA